MAAGAPVTLRYTGTSVKRLEDPRLLTGRARYLDDLVLPRMLSACFARSPHAHARISRIDAAAAAALPGVLAVVTADELRAVTKPLAPRLEGGGFTATAWPALADGVARFCGEAVAAVVASSPYVAADARELIAVDWEPLPAGGTLDAALAAGRVLFQRRHRKGDVDGAFARAAIVVDETFGHDRCAPSPLEPRGMIADWDGETLTVWSPSQCPSIMRTALAVALDLAEARVRIVTPDVGGGFGLKMQVFPEDVAVAALARRLGRPVKWVEERRENLAAASQAREQRTTVEVAAAADGTLLALRARVVSDAGAYHAYPTTGALEPLGTASILPGPSRTPAYEYEALALATHKPPLGAYRGVGMTMGAFVIERLLDLVAARAALDPAEVRRRNFIPREAYPFTSATGLTYDSGDFPTALEQVLAAVVYEKLRREQQAARAAGRAVGIGIACYTEYTGMGSAVFRERGMTDVPGIEAATLTMDPDATLRCTVSFPTQGQGHATTIARLAYSPPLGGLPDGLTPGLEASVYFDPPGPTFSGAIHVAVVEIDPDTGRVGVKRYALVEDCGPVINPMIVDGQIHGAVAQGIGEALLEAVVYDADGQLLTATLMDYALPRAADLPSFEIGHLETPSPITPGGVKGMGEGGTIGAPATIANAVADAVRHLGARITKLPIRPEPLLGRAEGARRPAVMRI